MNQLYTPRPIRRNYSSHDILPDLWQLAIAFRCRVFSWFSFGQFGLACILLSLGLCQAIQAQNFVWAKQLNLGFNSEGGPIAVDAFGNIYTTSYFEGSVDCDPGPSVFVLNSEGAGDIFVAKFNSLGNLVWAKRLGGTGDDYGKSVAVDNLGNVYITGSFANTVDFDPGPGVTNLTSAGSFDVFVSKLDANGNLVWAKQMGGTNFDQGTSVSVDISGNVYTTGYFYDTADFNPDLGVANLTSAGNFDVFVSRLDALGNFVWAKAIGSSSNDLSTSITIDLSGNIYTTGYFQGSADFDPGLGVTNLTSAGNTDVFVSKLDALGNFVWAKAMGGSNVDQGNSIVVDKLGNVYTTGYFEGSADFDPGSGIINLTSVGSDDIFISKLDAEGNLVWAKQMGSVSIDMGSSLLIDGSNSLYITGSFYNTIDFDPGPGTTNITSAGFADIFVSKFDASGAFLWVKTMGGYMSDRGTSIGIDGSGNIYTTGYFRSIVDFDPGPSVFNLTSVSSFDIFVSKLNQLNGVTSPSCVGSPTALSVTATGGTAPYSYTWVAPSGTTLSAINTVVTLVTPALAGVQNFTVLVAGSGGPTTTATISLTTNPLPTVTILPMSATLTCASPSVTLAAGGGIAYTLIGSSGIQSNTSGQFVINQPDTYTIAVTDSNSCSTIVINQTTTQLTWIGATSTDWSTATNWCPSQVPTSTNYTLIPSSYANQPIISTPAVVKSIEVKSGASVSIMAAGSLTINN